MGAPGDMSGAQLSDGAGELASEITRVSLPHSDHHYHPLTIDSVTRVPPDGDQVPGVGPDPGPGEVTRLRCAAQADQEPRAGMAGGGGLCPLG